METPRGTRIFEPKKMKMHLDNLIKLPGLLQSVLRNSKVQKKFMQKTLYFDIKKSKLENDNSLSDSDFRKITDYYGFAVPAILGEGFCLLRGQRMSERERTALTYLGALTGLFDDFFDEKKLSGQYLQNMMERPESAETQDANERLFVRFVKNALKNASDPKALKKAALKVYEAQILSKKQEDNKISQQEIEEITLQKGGFSILFYRSIFQQAADEAEKLMLYHLGGIGQMENDIFDIYNDHVKGIKTLATTTTHIHELRKAYHARMEEVFSLVHQTDFPTRNKKKFLRFVAMIVARGFVCLDFLEKNEKKTNSTFSLKDYPKKDLICDMGTLNNNLKLMAYHLKCDIRKK
jgi:hypothetical protein